METIFYDGIEIKYIVNKKWVKNLYTRMDKNNVMIISCPYLVSKKSIEKFVIESYFKILKKKEKKKKSIVNNGTIKILGNSYDLEEVNDMDYLLTIKLKEYLKHTYLSIVNSMNIKNPPNVILKRVKGYLGQYNKKKHQITLNILIAHMEEECVKYVIIHVLNHIKHMNHQKEFWDAMEVYLPEYKKLRSKCKKEFVYYENY